LTLASALHDELSAADAEKVEMLALDAQSSLLPYALVFFAFSLPIFVWTAAVAQNAVWMSALFIQFAVNWAASYFVVAWLRDRPDLASDLATRTRLHIFGGLLWAAAVAQLAAFALGAGPAREPLLLLATGAAIICFFFTSPSLPSLLIVGPLAAAPPLIGLYMSPSTRITGDSAWGGIALAMALSLIMNRTLRRQFCMTAERERLVTERAQALAEAKQLANSKSDILATLSHEIRNGLTGVSHVLAAAAGLVGRVSPSRDQLTAALGASNDLLGVLNATLDSESAQRGRLSLEAQPFDACRMIRALTLLARPDAAAKGLELTFHIEKELEAEGGAAVADSLRVRQIVSNLIGNAIKYTVRGRIEVRLRKARPDRLLIEIADTGPGLSSEELAHAFQPFRRVERTSAGVSGAGLGLSLSRDLARLMGGEVSAESAPGVGSRFWLELPFDRAATAAEADAVADGRHDLFPLRSLRVLVAEGDGLNAAMLRSVLEQLGHQMAHVTDGRRILDLAQICDFDLIMIDARIPNMDGPQAIRALRALDHPVAQAPIIAVIGGDAVDAKACMDAGADAMLRKPASVAGVARAVAAAVSIRRMSGIDGAGGSSPLRAQG
jgi:signal transduction histidine kinase/ActR/RegA family two-component response regulator